MSMNYQFFFQSVTGAEWERAVSSSFFIYKEYKISTIQTKAYHSSHYCIGLYKMLMIDIYDMVRIFL